MKSEEASNGQSSAASSLFGKVTNIKFIKEKFHSSKESIQSSSSKIKENISNSIHKKAEETTEFIDNVKNKNSKVRNLETLLGLQKSNIVSSDNTTSFYKWSKEKIVVLDKDVLGEPINVTVKEGSKVTVYVVKYCGYTPFLYPHYDEKDISGEIIYLDNEEIWYRDLNKLTIGYNSSNNMEFYKVSISELIGLSDENLIPYIKKYSAVLRSLKLSKLVKIKQLELNNIIKLSENYIVYKNKDTGYRIYVYNYSIQDFEEISLGRLPRIELSSYDTLLSVEILKFIMENRYPIEDFEQKESYIEYNKEIGRNKISVMRFKV